MLGIREAVRLRSRPRRHSLQDSRQVLRQDRAVIGQRGGAPQRMTQFTNVAGPVVSLEHAGRRRRQRHRVTLFARRLGAQVLRQFGDILKPLTQRGNHDLQLA